MLRLRVLTRTALLLALVTVLVLPPWAQVGDAASHREAPVISMDPEADITDFFMFRSYEPGKGDKLILIMDVIPGEEPSSGPNYWNFDPNVLYSFEIDNDGDGKANDVSFEFSFTTELRGEVTALKLPLSYLGDADAPDKLPPITKLDGPGSEGLGLRQKYSVTMVKGNDRTVIADGLIAVPSNVGPRTMPDYDALAAQGIYNLDLPGGGGRVFAGQRDDPFYIDLGATFDTLNFRRNPPLLTMAEDANDGAVDAQWFNPFGVDMLSGFNVNTIALEVPMSLIRRAGQPKIGAYASTARRNVHVIRRDGGPVDSGRFIQVQRLANPLINEVIIGTQDKDAWNAVDPQDEAQFLDYYLNPRLALALQLVFGVPAATSNRTDLRDALLKYAPTDTQLSELLRLDTTVPPTPLANQHRLGPLAHDAAGNPTPDPAGWPNGRRPKDDVTDVAVRLVGGPNYIQALAGDGVNFNDKPLTTSFPFLASPHNGRNRVHQNP